jgi:acyl-CoA reductase-like NAD-dependent aldehyde dehydrogenase
VAANRLEESNDHIVGKIVEVSRTATLTLSAAQTQTADRLRAAQPVWHAMGVEERGVWLGRWSDWILDHFDELMSLIQRETGKSWGDVAASEGFVAQMINYWVDNAAEFLADENVRPSGVLNAAKKLTVVYEPYPLIGAITGADVGMG